MTENLRHKILFRCPVCSKTGYIHLEDDLINRAGSGLSTINIEKELTCEHSFIAYIDRNHNVRDCFVVDLKIELPKIDVKEMEPSKAEKNFDIDLININLIPSQVVYILKGVFSGKGVVVLTEQAILQNQFTNFFKYIIGDTFKYDILFLSNSEYKKERKKYDDYLVIEGLKIIRDKSKLLENKNLKIERVIVQKFFSEYDKDLGLFLIKSEINKVHKISNDIIDFNAKLGEDMEFGLKNVMEHLERAYYVTFPLPYLKYIEKIVENYFKVELKKVTEVSDFLDFL